MTTASIQKAAGYTDSLQQLIDGLKYIELRIRWAVARARAQDSNPDDAFRGLYVSDEQVDSLLSLGIGENQWAKNGHSAKHQRENLLNWPTQIASCFEEWRAQTKISRRSNLYLPLDDLVRAFHLSPTDLDIILIALAPEIDLRFERLFAYLQDDVTRKRPSIDLILNLLSPSPAERLRLRPSLSENGRLAGQGLIQYSHSGQGRQESSRLAHFVTIPSHIVNFLLGENGVDSHIAGWGQLVDSRDSADPRFVPANLLAQMEAANQGEPRPIFCLTGQKGMGKHEAALLLAAQQDQSLLTIDVATMLATATTPHHPMPEIDLALRDGRLFNATLYFFGWDALSENQTLLEKIWRRLRSYPHTIVLGSQTSWQPQTAPRQRPVYLIALSAPGYSQRLLYWQRQLTSENLGKSDLKSLANHFRFTPGQIEHAVATARDIAAWENRSLTVEDLFAASRQHSNQKLNSQATKIQPRYRWEDIVLPADTRLQLQEMVNTVQQRPTVYGRWGFGQKLALGKGLNALFAGESGTGKTMAADIMAGRLGLDLYKIDLSSLVSKYIGETEKNLERIFSEAATSNAILFFDEADAIFGKRSEVKDSHDRYANIEISYLLQRMEAYDGVVILATNLRANLDDAFTRRLHFAIEFPFPEARDRERIWRVNIPAEVPLSPDIDFSLLAERFRLAGGNIRNIILAAAFLAAEVNTPVQMSHFLHAARREYQKMGRLIDEKLFAAPKP